MVLRLCYSGLVFVMLSRLLIDALWSLKGKRLTSWLLFVMFIVIFGILGHMCFLIVSIPDLCCLSYFISLNIEILDVKAMISALFH